MQRVTGWTGFGLGLMVAFALSGCKDHSENPVADNSANPSASAAGATNAYATNPFPKGPTGAELQAGIAQITNDPNMTPQQKRQAIGVLKSHFPAAGAGAPR